MALRVVFSLAVVCMGPLGVVSQVTSAFGFGSGLSRATLGEITTFWIRAVDASGVNMTIGGATFKVQMKSPDNANNPKVTLADLGNGLYQGTYTIALTDPPVIGTYTMEATLQTADGAKVAVRGSPYSIITVELAPLDPSRCSARNIPDAVTAGVKSQFSVITRDINGNVLTQGNVDFAVSLTQNGVPAGQATTKYIGDGEYIVEFMATRSGTPLSVYVRIGMPLTHVAGSPFSVFVHPGMLYPANCDARGPGLEGGKKGDQLSFLIIEQDAYNNDRLTTTSQAAVTAYFQNDPTPISIAKNKNGTLTASFIAPKGQRYINVKIDGVDISGSPFMVRYEGAGILTESSAGVVIGFLCAGVFYGVFRYRTRLHDLAKSRLTGTEIPRDTVTEHPVTIAPASPATVLTQYTPQRDLTNIILPSDSDDSDGAVY